MPLYAIIESYGVYAPPFAVVADDQGADYVFMDGVTETGGLTSEYVRTKALNAGITPADADEWLRVATANLGIVQVNAPRETSTIEEARTEAARKLEIAFSLDEPRNSNVLPENLEDEDELELALTLAGVVDPTVAHRWLPINVTAVECAFCEMPEDAPIHRYSRT